MRFFISRITLFALATTGIIAAPNQPGHFGLGGILGEPTGLSAKYVISDQIAVQGALGLSVIEKGFWISSDLLLQFHNVFTHDGRWPVYIGAGIVVQDRGNSGKTNKGESSLGLRAVGGAEFHATNKISIFAEASIHPFIIPSIGFGVGVGLGARYWF